MFIIYKFMHGKTFDDKDCIDVKGTAHIVAKEKKMRSSRAVNVKMIKKIDSTRYVTDHEIRQFAAMSACTAGYIIAFVFAIDKYHFTRLSSK
jgi:hypothetical protein